MSLISTKSCSAMGHEMHENDPWDVEIPPCAFIRSHLQATQDNLLQVSETLLHVVSEIATRCRVVPV